MKTISKIFGLLLILGITLSFNSCGSDDDDPYVEARKEVVYTYTSTLKGLADAKSTLKLNDLTLSQVIGETEAKNFIKGEFQMSRSYLEVSGLSAMDSKPTLKDFTLQLNSESPINWGNCNSQGATSNHFLSDTQYSSNKYITFINSIFNSLVSGRRIAQFNVSFTSDKDVLESNNVTLKITIKGYYWYRDYSSIQK